MRDHGTRARYVKDNCRCDFCRAANAAYFRARRTPRADYDRQRHRHPSLNCYRRHGCRCRLCRIMNAYDWRLRYEQRAWR